MKELKNSMKRTLLFICLHLVGIIWASAYDFSAVAPTGQTLYYNIVDDEAHVTCPSTFMNFYWGGYASPTGSLTIPVNVLHNGTTYTVTSIGECAFNGCNDLTSVTIPNSVTSIGAAAFYNCSGLTSVTIPNSVTAVGESAFAGCSGLTAPVYNNVVFAFLPPSYSGSYAIPTGITTIAGDAFSGCHGLTSVTIPNTVTSIEEFAFLNCSGLTSIVVDSGNSTYDSRNGCNAIVETATNTLVAGCQNTVIPNTVTAIGNGAFYGCSGLTSVTIPGSVSTIGNKAFYDCSGLTSISIPNTVTSIGNHVLSGCSGLSSPVYNTSHFVLLPSSYCGSFAIPDGITAICGSAFYDCAYMTSVEIPSTVTAIGVGAFTNCSGLTSVTIPNNVESIEIDVFFGCTGLTSVDIPNSVTTIESWAFYGCWGLAALTLPSSLTTVESYAFSDCRGLTNVTCMATTPPSCDSTAFSEVSSTRTLTVPCGAEQAYRDSDWCSYFANISCPDVAVEEATEDDKLQVWTSDGHIFVRIGRRKVKDFDVYDMMGRDVCNGNLPAGVYMVRVGNHPARKVAVIR